MQSRYFVCPSVYVVYIQLCYAQMMMRESWGCNTPSPSSSLSIEGKQVFDWTMKMKDSCHDACTSERVLAMCVSLCLRAYIIVSVLSANALECISLEIFLRNGLAPARESVPLLMPFYSCPISNVSFHFKYDLLDLSHSPVKTSAI